MTKNLLLLLCVAIGVFIFLPSELRVWQEKPEPIPCINDAEEKETVYVSAFIYERSEREIRADDRERVLFYIESAKPRVVSHTDSVYGEDYYGVCVSDGENTYHYFVYKKWNRTYIEMPYVGVYEADGELYEILSFYMDAE